jgi:hypothetical protein
VVSEIDGESSGAIGVHGVGARSRGVSKVGEDETVNDYGVDLSQIACAVKLSHRRADHWEGRSSAEFGAFDGESVVPVMSLLLQNRESLCA